MKLSAAMNNHLMIPKAAGMKTALSKSEKLSKTKRRLKLPPVNRMPMMKKSRESEKPNISGKSPCSLAILRNKRAIEEKLKSFGILINASEEQNDDDEQPSKVIESSPVADEFVTGVKERTFDASAGIEENFCKEEQPKKMSKFKMRQMKNKQ
mmetsp:Transcript_16275/g.18821  ORF Transcript_16275/g.18821 Transcript_16275/m.18821 type:complete len:153 (+) Transcript_16275:374-832(+)